MDDIVLPKWARVEEALPGQDGKMCGECRRWLTTGVGGTWPSFHRHYKEPDGLKRQCKECMGVYHATHAKGLRAARRKYNIVHGRSPIVATGDVGDFRRFMRDGDAGLSASEKNDADAFKAFLDGASIYDWQKEND